MAVTILATPGDPAANSYVDLAEAQVLFASRPPIAQWESADDPSVLLVWGTSVFEAMFSPRRVLVRDPVNGSYYRTYPTWTGVPSTTTQALSWPRTGMYTRNGALISPTVIPLDLKKAFIEFVGQLAVAPDRVDDNDIITQGITSIKAGSVALTFKNGAGEIEAKVIPDAVWNLLPPGWLTDELVEYTSLNTFEFDVL